MTLSNIAKLRIYDDSQHLVDVHRYLLMYNGVDQVLDRGHGWLLLQMNIDWENAPDGFVAWEEAGDIVYNALKSIETQLQKIERSYRFEWIEYQKAIPENHE